MRLIFFIILFGTGNAQRNDRDTSILSTREFIPSCKVQSKDEQNEHVFFKDYDVFPAVRTLRSIIQKIEEPLTKLLAQQDFEIFTLLDLMEILDEILDNMNDRTCSTILSGLHELRLFNELWGYPDENPGWREPDQVTNEIVSFARIIAGSSWCILQEIRYFIKLIKRKRFSISSPNKFERLMRMSKTAKSFLVR